MLFFGKEKGKDDGYGFARLDELRKVRPLPFEKSVKKYGRRLAQLDYGYAMFLDIYKLHNALANAVEYNERVGRGEENILAPQLNRDCLELHSMNAAQCFWDVSILMTGMSSAREHGVDGDPYECVEMYLDAMGGLGRVSQLAASSRKYESTPTLEFIRDVCERVDAADREDQMKEGDWVSSSNALGMRLFEERGLDPYYVDKDGIRATV